MVSRGRDDEVVPIWPVAAADFPQWRAARPDTEQTWLGETAYAPERYRLGLLPGPDGTLGGVVLGLGNVPDSPWSFAGLPRQLPGSRRYRFMLTGADRAATAALGWAIGDYDYERYRARPVDAPATAALDWPADCDRAPIERTAAAVHLVRDLINTPAGDLGPDELAEAARQVAGRCDADFRQIVGDELLEQRLAAIHAVGRASPRPPRLIELLWGRPDDPAVTLVGKGVCFDTGGLDIKNAQGMLLMKKDMGGAAHALGLAQLIMQSGLRVRLRVLVPAVDNAIAGNAYRPGDVLQTRKGLSVEVGNTDAEGRLILCDALALADEEPPALLIDLATLTGAARVALGPDLPALYATVDADAQALLAHGLAADDPLWRMPLWAPYQEDLASKIADVNHIPPHGLAGSVAAALFLQRFVTASRHWLHLDLYGWNAKERPGRPVGGEAQGLRALFALVAERYPA